jgi:hypothetical protein
MLHAFAMTLALTGCDGRGASSENSNTNKGSCDETDWYADLDGDNHGNESAVISACKAPDGYVVRGADCDDSDSTVHPNAVEFCNGQDDNCDGLVDPSTSADAEEWYADVDGDGFGDPDSTVLACNQPDGHLSVAGDCNDSVPAIHPGAAEIWYDGVDQNCDGASDFDADGDGFDHPAGNGQDCNDEDPGIHPDAEEVCGDGVDQDCDGGPGTCGTWGDQTSEQADGVLAGAHYWQWAGFAVSWAGDVNGDGFADALVGAIGDSTEEDRAGVAYVVGGPLTGSISLATDSLATIGGTAGNDFLGSQVAPAGDVDADGYDDVIVTAPGADHSSENEGAVYFLFGPVSGQIRAEDADWTVYGSSWEDLLGKNPPLVSVFNATDPQLVLSTYLDDTYGNSSGVIHILDFALTDGSVDDLASTTIHRTHKDAHFGLPSNVGDIDGDGLSDLFASANGDNPYGRAYLFLDPPQGTWTIDVADSVVRCEIDYCFPGVGSTSPVDINDDGYADLAMYAGASFDPGASTGSARIFLGPVTAPTLDPEEAEIIINGTELLHYIGTRIRGADLDGDGDDELVLGSWYTDAGADERGAVYVFDDPEPGEYVVDEAEGVLLGAQEADYFGYAVAGRGDANGDGIDDLLIGAYGAPNGASYGAAYLFLGGAM